ncbi:hypothetical protein [Metabacillus bambusae]|uniref:FbpB family small basic protein n=1 Tax=Metabacillus bambusae TaxID=2795218 RepID=A0ABS3N065_9BACI|nr:hypothetical protein [Metabacillus bambusae]MBO1511549.1 hypothetical protein [Metabacillus bambusae]
MKRKGAVKSIREIEFEFKIRELKRDAEIHDFLFKQKLALIEMKRKKLISK